MDRSFRLFKERNCTVAVALDTRSQGKSGKEFPVALRFTVDRKAFYLAVGGSYSEKQFSDICRAKRCTSQNFRIQSELRGMYEEKYRKLLTELNKGGTLTFEMVRQAVRTGNPHIVSAAGTPQCDEEQSFIGVWKDTIRRLKTEDNGRRYTTGISYQCALTSFELILGKNTVKGFHISKIEIQKWKDGMQHGKPGKGGRLVGKISDTTVSIYLRVCRAVWNSCVRMGYLKDVEYPFSNKRELGLVSIPRSGQRRESFLNVERMTELYNLFLSRRYPEEWSSAFTAKAHYSLGLFLAQYLCNGCNLADLARLRYDSFYFQNDCRGLRFNRQKTADRSQDKSEVIIPVTAPLKRILDDVAARPERDGLVFPGILAGADSEKRCYELITQENANVRKRVIRICHEALGWDASIRPSGTWCRHSFATNLRNAGVDIDYISDSMGHSSADHAITHIYIARYSLDVRMRNNLKLLHTDECDSATRKELMSRLMSLSEDELKTLLHQVTA